MNEHVNGHDQINRRGFISGLMGATLGGSLVRTSAQTEARAQGPRRKEAGGPLHASAASLTPWIFLHSPLEHWLPDYQRTFDAWAEGGVRGIVVGYLQFQ